MKELVKRVAVLEEDAASDRRVDLKLYAIAQENKDRLERVELNIGHLENKVDTLEGRLDKVEHRLGRVESQLLSLREDLPEIVGNAVRDVINKR